MCICLKEVIEIGFSLSLVANALFFIPQIITLLKTKDSKGLSLLMFIGFNITQLFTILHAYLVRDYTLMAGFIGALVTSGMVTLLIILYRRK
jgi:MtN3 and saliva related transmembrane protein